MYKVVYFFSGHSVCMYVCMYVCTLDVFQHYFDISTAFYVTQTEHQMSESPLLQVWSSLKPILHGSSYVNVFVAIYNILDNTVLSRYRLFSIHFRMISAGNL